MSLSLLVGAFWIDCEADRTFRAVLVGVLVGTLSQLAGGGQRDRQSYSQSINRSLPGPPSHSSIPSPPKRRSLPAPPIKASSPPKP